MRGIAILHVALLCFAQVFTTAGHTGRYWSTYYVILQYYYVCNGRSFPTARSTHFSRSNCYRHYYYRNFSPCMQKPIVGKFSRLLEIGHFRTSAALCMQGCVLYRKPKYLIWTSVLFFPSTKTPSQHRICSHTFTSDPPVEINRGKSPEYLTTIEISFVRADFNNSLL